MRNNENFTMLLIINFIIAEACDWKLENRVIVTINAVIVLVVVLMELKKK